MISKEEFTRQLENTAQELSNLVRQKGGFAVLARSFFLSLIICQFALYRCLIAFGFNVENAFLGIVCAFLTFFPFLFVCVKRLRFFSPNGEFETEKNIRWQKILQNFDIYEVNNDVLPDLSNSGLSIAALKKFYDKDMCNHIYHVDGKNNFWIVDTDDVCENIFCWKANKAIDGAVYLQAKGKNDKSNQDDLKIDHPLILGERMLLRDNRQLSFYDADKIQLDRAKQIADAFSFDYNICYFMQYKDFVFFKTEFFNTISPNILDAYIVGKKTWCEWWNKQNPKILLRPANTYARVYASTYEEIYENINNLYNQLCILHTLAQGEKSVNNS